MEEKQVLLDAHHKCINWVGRVIKGSAKFEGLLYAWVILT